MELYKEILCHALQDSRIEVTFPDLKPASDLFGEVCYRTLKKSKRFWRIMRKAMANALKALKTSQKFLKALAAAFTADMITDNKKPPRKGDVLSGEFKKHR